MRDFSTAVKMLQGNYWLQIQCDAKEAFKEKVESTLCITSPSLITGDYLTVAYAMSQMQL